MEASRPLNLRRAVELFEEKHEATYGYTHSGEDVEVAAARVAVVVPSKRPVFTQRPNSPTSKSVRLRRVFFGQEFVDANVIRRDSLQAGDEVEGPAVLEEYDSTTVIPPGWRASVDGTGCLVMKR